MLYAQLLEGEWTHSVIKVYRSCCEPHDVHCRDWIRNEVSTEDLSKDCNLKGIKKQLLRSDDLPVFEAKQITLDGLMEEGDRLVHEVHTLQPASHEQFSFSFSCCIQSFLCCLAASKLRLAVQLDEVDMCCMQHVGHRDSRH